MDTSKEYIEMCRQLPKEMHSDIIDGDFYYWNVPSQNDGMICISYTEIFEDYTVHYPEQWDYLNGRECVKLYRQDQLQDMVIEKYNKHWGDSVMLGLMEEVVGWGAQHAYASMEQAWLAFVMDEKYGKLWNGSEWVVK